jgi:hypothetical protein
MTPPDWDDASVAFALELRDQLAQVLLPDQVQKLNLVVRDLVKQVADDGTPTLELVTGALSKMSLAPDQKVQIDAVLKTAQQDLAHIKSMSAAGQDIADQVEVFRQRLRTAVAAILNLDQLEQLRKLMQPAQASANPPPESAEARPHIAVPASRPDAETNKSTGAQIGAILPDFSVAELNGVKVTPDSFKGKVLVIEFGSYTCPEFRTHVAAMENLKTEFSSKVTFLIVYTREAYPTGPREIDRNIEAGISIPVHSTLADRREAAAKAKNALHITIPIAIDSMDSTMTETYGGFPNGTIVADKDGYVTARQRWNTIDGLRVAIQEAINQ